MTIWDKYQEYIDPMPKIGELPHQNAITDCPLIYHEVCLYTILGTLIGRKRYFPFGHQHIYPNIWSVILGETSRMHKSTAVSIALKFLRHSKSNSILPNDFTSEKLVEVLQLNPVGLFVFFEFSTFLENMDKEYNAGTRALLTELFDCPEYYTRQTKGADVIIEKPCLSILSASTPDWLKASETNIKGGLLTRVLFIGASASDKKFNVDIPAEDNKDLFKSICSDLKFIAEYPKEVKYSMGDEAKKTYSEHCRHIENVQEDGRNYSIKTLFSRQNIYTIKIAMVIQTLIDPESFELSGVAMEYACTFVRRAVESMEKVFNEIPKSKSDGDLKKVLSLIKREGIGIRRSKLIKNSHMLSRDLDNVLRTLEEQGDIVSNEEEPKVYMAT